MEGLEALCLGGPAFFGLRISLLPLRSLLAMSCSSNAFEPDGQRSGPVREQVSLPADRGEVFCLVVTDDLGVQVIARAFRRLPLSRTTDMHRAPLFPLRSSTGPASCRREA